MNQLKFSHNYLKLPPNWEGKKATLLFVREIELEKQRDSFLSYDTRYAYYSPLCGESRSNYSLPKKGKYLLLLFECEGTVFTTLRRSTPEKKAYYESEAAWKKKFELVKVVEQTAKK